MNSQKTKGFTLLELMVAISIFSVVSLLTMGGLSNVLNTRAHTEENLQRLTRFQMIFTILNRELQQLNHRSVRDEYGAILDDISHETSDGIAGIEFTHQGRIVLGEQVSLQRVAYYLEDKQLIKKIWPILDRLEDTKPVKQVLMDNIDELSFSFFTADASAQGNNDGQWQEDWSGSVSQSSGNELRAVRISLKTADYDELYRIFEVVP